MKVIRQSIFETNSSSSHSVSVKRNKGAQDKNFLINKSGKVILTFGIGKNFACDYTEYTDANTKLNYLACMALQCHQQLLRNHNRENSCNIDDVLKIKDIKKLESCLKKNVKGFTGFVILPDALWVYKSEYSLESQIMCEGGIDHQSYEDFGNIDDFLKYWKVSLENFLFNPRVTLIISSDW